MIIRPSAQWLALGIDLDMIPPARSDQIGSHEITQRDSALEVEKKSASDFKKTKCIRCMEKRVES